MKYLVTTSRRASARTRSFAKELAGCLPAATRLNRGKKSLEDLYHYSLLEQYDVVIVIYERMGNPSKIIFLVPDVAQGKLRNVLELYIKGVSLAREKTAPYRKSKIACIKGDEQSRVLVKKLSTILNLPLCPQDPLYKAWISIRQVSSDEIKLSCLHRGGIAGPSIKVYRYEFDM